MSKTLKCFGCKEVFPVEELTNYCTARAVHGHYYCKHCLPLVQGREKFSNQVCRIFGLKAPGPRIWTERRRLIDKYGYTDDTLIDTLDYLYNDQKLVHITESIYRINPETVEAAIEYKKQKRAENDKIAAAFVEQSAQMAEKRKVNITLKEKEIKELNPDDYLTDD